jgi:Phosphotransferase system mannitol/fructose-specific IIA domain (Ntr-type)
MSVKIFTGKLISRGDVYYNIQGESPEEVIASLVKVVRTSKALDKSLLRDALLERESLGSTALGNGFAIPHPRKQLAKSENEAVIALGYLDTPVDWNAPDGKPVAIVFLLLSFDTKEHLVALSELACLAQDPGFKEFIAKHPSKSALLEYLETSNRESCQDLQNPKPTK